MNYLIPETGVAGISAKLKMQNVIVSIKSLIL